MPNNYLSTISHKIVPKMSSHWMCSVYIVSQWVWIFFIPVMVLSSPILPGRDIAQHWEATVLKQRLKLNILQGLNRTRAPFITPRTLPVYAKSKVIEGMARAPKSKNTSLILSEPTDPYRRDFMVFKIHSKVRSRLSYKVFPIIVLRFRLKSKRSFSKKKDKTAILRMKIYEKVCKNNDKNVKSVNMSTQLKSMNISLEDSKIVLNSTDICKNLSKKARKANRRRRPKTRKIRVVVRVMDPLTNKKIKIYGAKLVLKKFKVLSVTVPRDIFIRASESEQHALTVQVSCRNCKRHVKMDRVYGKGKKKANGKLLRLNPNRPLMYVTTVEEHDKKIDELSRSKRDVISAMPTQACSYFDNANEKNIDVFGYHHHNHHHHHHHHHHNHHHCCEERNYYTFEELGLSDFIVYPRGFYTVDCLGSCKHVEEDMLRSKQFTHNTFKNDGDTLTSDRRPSCVSTTKSSLDIVYFEDSNTIIPQRLVDFIGDSCGCGSV